VVGTSLVSPTVGYVREMGSTQTTTPGSREGSGTRAPFAFRGQLTGPVAATAIHAGHELRDEVRRRILLSDADRLREEDPYTDRLIAPAGLQVVVDRSRFEVDLNRQRGDAVYRGPEDAWGLDLWDGPLPEPLIRRSLDIYDEFYSRLAALLDQLAEEGPFVLLDVHSYNHRRGGPQAAAPPESNPDINVGTGTLPRDRCAPVVETLMDSLRGQQVAGRRLDVRENVRFEGANLDRWVHERYPETACAPALEFKKTFMDEWTGQVYEQDLHELTSALASTVPDVVRVVDGER
jgi:N-formylglutamate deformylase